MPYCIYDTALTQVQKEEGVLLESRHAETKEIFLPGQIDLPSSQHIIKLIARAILLTKLSHDSGIHTSFQKDTVPILFIYFFCLSAFPRATPVANGCSQARGLIGAVAASLRQSHSNSNMVSEPRL